MLQRGEQVTKLLDRGGYFQGTVLSVFQNLNGEWMAFCEGPPENYWLAYPHSLKASKQDIILVSASN